MKVRPSIKDKPVFEGVNAWRTNNKLKMKCLRCTRFATHVGLSTTTNLRVLMCPTHTRIYSKEGAVHKVEALAEYKKYLRDMEQWKLQQQIAEQGEMFR